MSEPQNRVNLTAGRVDAFKCPQDKSQAFLWDTDTPTLALRATPTGRKTYVFEARLNGSTIRINIGTLADWPIKQARLKAQGLKMLVDSGNPLRNHGLTHRAITTNSRRCRLSTHRVSKTQCQNCPR